MKTTTLYDLNRYFDNCVVLGKRDPIIDNHESRMLTVLLWGINGNSVCLRGESGSAKTKILNASTALMFGSNGLSGQNHEVLLMNSSSAKGQLTDDSAMRIAHAQRCVIPELQNIMTSQNLEAMIKLWMEDRPYIYARNELGRRQKRIILDPLPILTNLADGNEDMPDLPNEMQRRTISLPTISTKDLNERVHIMKARARMLPDKDLIGLSKLEMTTLHRQCHNAMFDKRRVVNPGAPIIRKAIPTRYTMSNTFIDYFLDVIEAIAKFHANERLSDGSKYIFASPEDNYQALKIAGSTFRDMSIGIASLGREIIDFVPKVEAWGDLATDVESDAATLDDIIDYLTELGMIRNKTTVKSILERLVNTNFIRKIDRKDKYYRTQDMEFEYTVDLKELADGCKENMSLYYPEFSADYNEFPDEYTCYMTGKVKKFETK
jgi:predicted transcriptional regulator|tara:strand:+ start:1251 stop:2555 length:1305 start_codon:yes stop_codon:yes gene_type:complete